MSTTPGHDLYETLAAHAGLAGLVGAHIFPSQIPEEREKPRPDLYPCVVYDIDYDAEPTHDQNDSGLFRVAFVTLAAFSRASANECRLVVEQLKLAMAGFVGLINGRTWSGAKYEDEDTTEWVAERETWFLEVRFTVMVHG